MKSVSFVPGLALNRGFFFEVVEPLLAREFPHLRYSAGLLGYGSDVLGFDNATSMDHNWGPRCLIFVEPKDLVLRDRIRDVLAWQLPFRYRGFSTHFSAPRDDGTQTLESTDRYPVRHLVEVVALEAWFAEHLGTGEGLPPSVSDWLKVPDQILRELTSGEVYHDGLGRLDDLRTALKGPPEDVRRLKLAALWNAVWTEEPFLGRCVETEDPLGLRLVAARVVNALLKVAFVLERVPIPYGKWFGRAFGQLSSAPLLGPLARAALEAGEPAAVEAGVVALSAALVGLHNAQADLPRLNNRVQDFFGRPYRVIFAETIAKALVSSLDDHELRTTDLEDLARALGCGS